MRMILWSRETRFPAPQETSHLKRLIRIRLAHWNIGILRTIRRFLDRRRRGLGQLSQIKSHSGLKMPRLLPAIASLN